MKTALSVHGFPVPSSNATHITYADGTAFFWLADTWWYGMTKRMPLSIFKKLAIYRAAQGFTVIQVVVGVPPEVHWQDGSGANSGGLPFLANKALNTAYFDEVDKKIKILIEAGLVPCIVGGWGHHIDEIGREPIRALWREIVRRYGKMPVVWCLCGEIDLFPPPGYANSPSKRLIFAPLRKSRIGDVIVRIAKKVFGLDSRNLLHHRLTAWALIVKDIKRMQSMPHLLTIHPQGRSTASKLLSNPTWLDIDAIQSSHSKESITFMVEAIRGARSTHKPIINLEPWYEGILGNFSAPWQRYAFWACILSGAAGHSYGAHGLWQMATRTDRFMGHWGVVDWQTASAFAGARQLGRAKQWLEKLPWWNLVPDTTIVTPAWQSDDPRGAFGAQIKNTHRLIYIPAGEAQRYFTIYGFKGNKSYHVTIIDPRSMRTRTHMRVRAPNFRISHSGAVDTLVFVTKG